MAAALTIDSVWKCFRTKHDRPTTLRESVLGLCRGRAPRRQPSVWALRDVSFAVEQGTALGIIGHNGAGKSTLLRLLCGVGRPTRGRIERRGPVGGLLELGGGFHLDLAGRENVVTAGILNGLTRAEVRRREPDIVAFAELEEAIDMPLRTYSNGMYLRLAFAVAMELDPAALVIDEVLSVGDLRFQQKCLERIDAFRAAGKTLILVSHVPEQVKSLCDEVLVLDDGRVVLRDDPQNALRCYTELMQRRTERRAARLRGTRDAPARTGIAPARGRREGTHEAAIERVRLTDEGGRPSETIDSNGALIVELDYRVASAPLLDAAISLGIYSAAEVKCFEVCIDSTRETFGPLTDSGTLRCRIPRLPLQPGTYFVNVGLYPPNFDFVYDYHWQLHELRVAGTRPPAADVSGVLALDPSWSVV